MVVEHGSLHMTDVKETRWLRGESGYYLTIDGIFESVFVVCVYWVFLVHIFNNNELTKKAHKFKEILTNDIERIEQRRMVLN